MTLGAQVPSRTSDQVHLGNCRCENPRQWQGRPQGAGNGNLTPHRLDTTVTPTSAVCKTQTWLRRCLGGPEGWACPRDGQVRCLTGKFCSFPSPPCSRTRVALLRLRFQGRRGGGGKGQDAERVRGTQSRPPRVLPGARPTQRVRTSGGCAQGLRSRRASQTNADRRPGGDTTSRGQVPCMSPGT